MRQYGHFWQHASSQSGLISFGALKSHCRTPLTFLQISEKINCRAWSLNALDKRAVFDRIMAAQMILQHFSISPVILKNIYFFKRKRARSIFKKRLNNYISFQLVCNIPLEEWISIIRMIRFFTNIIRANYNLPAGLFVTKSKNLLAFRSVNPSVLFAFLRNEPILIKPQVLAGFCQIQRGSAINADWLLEKFNEAS